jgi:hypothetical protein
VNASDRRLTGSGKSRFSLSPNPSSTLPAEQHFPGITCCVRMCPPLRDTSRPSAACEGKIAHSRHQTAACAITAIISTTCACSTVWTNVRRMLEHDWSECMVVFRIISNQTACALSVRAADCSKTGGELIGSGTAIAGCTRGVLLEQLLRYVCLYANSLKASTCQA